MDMLNGGLAGKLILFAIPLAFSSILQQLFNSADVAVVGRFAGDTALAAVGSCVALVGIFVNLIVGLSVGPNAALATLIGQKKREQINGMLHTILTFGAVLGLLLMCLGMLSARTVLELSGTPESVMNQALLYIRIYFISIPFMVVYNFGSAILRSVDRYCLTSDAEEISRLREKARQHHYYLSPNVYLERRGKRYDTSLWITPDGELADTAQMVHIAQAEQFYEQDYYTPSDTGFKVFDTPFGKIGIVICYDRHLPESIRTCTLKGADLIIVPTANTKAEPMEMFEWEMRVQAMQNQVFIAMCNRVGKEDAMDFSGESPVIHPSGDILVKADDSEQLLTCEVSLQEASLWKNKMPYLKTRRPECYV